MRFLPRCSTLFPYTTLYRSDWCRSSNTIVTGSADRSVRVWNPDGRLRKAFENLGNAIQSVTITADGNEALITRGYEGTTDRKSTRLNSSHLVISYAVFFLKN